MAVTTQKSTEYTNATATPVTLNEANVYHGRVRIAYFTHDQDGAGDAGSSVALCSLPAGKVKVLLSQSKAYVNWTTSSATLDLGWDAYTDIDGDAVAADADGLVDGLDVDTVGYQTLEGALAGIKATGGTHTFETQSGVVIRATSPTAIADGDDLVGYILYVVD
ncbi:MAG: hypothetical protein QF704_14475 [Anaerolineales bacterium]|jgi:hypothetical protein|nr:hypothetical protein [Anaerolineales bacterium]